MPAQSYTRPARKLGIRRAPFLLAALRVVINSFFSCLIKKPNKAKDLKIQ